MLAALEPAPDTEETLDFGLSVLDLLTESGVLVPEWDFRREPVNSVSGGVGGLVSFFEAEVDDFRSGKVESAGFGALGSDPRSVCSGVNGSDFFVRSSRL